MPVPCVGSPELIPITEIDCFENGHKILTSMSFSVNLSIQKLNFLTAAIASVSANRIGCAESEHYICVNWKFKFMYHCFGLAYGKSLFDYE